MVRSGSSAGGGASSVRGRYGLGALLGLALVASACGDGKTTGQRPSLAWDLPADPSGLADYLLDFELVPIGTKATRAVTVRNTGSATLLLRLKHPAAPFGLDRAEEELSIAVGATGTLPFSFLPAEEDPKPRQILVTVSTNEAGLEEGRTVRLVGRGVPPGLSCDPADLDFGQVVRGSSKTGSLVCRNGLGVAIDVKLEGFKGNFRRAFTAQAKGAEGGHLLVEPEGSIEIEIAFDAQTVGRNDAVLVIRDVNEQLLAEVGVEADVVASALQLVSNTCLDFGYVGVGEEAQASIQVKNIGTREVRITGGAIPTAASPTFSLRSSLPIAVAPEAVVEILVAFHPGEAGLHTSELQLTTDDGAEVGALVACMSGFGGGPKLVCSQDFIDFGLVALERPVLRRVHCANEGYAPPGGSVDRLKVSVPVTDRELFAPTIRNRDGSTGPKSLGYEIGDSFDLEILYSPVEESFDTGTITMESTAASGGAARIQVAGQGRDLPPCEYSLIPPALQFGIVERGDTLTQSFGIRNELTTSCLVNDLHLSDDSDPTFSVEPIGSAEIGGLETLEVPVTFAPTEYRPRLTGKVQFQISSENDRFQEVTLVGSSAEACLIIRPGELDFGKAMPGCQTQERLLTISNVCAAPIKVTEVELNPTLGSDAFKVVQRPILPATIQPGRVEDFTMIYSPTAVGPDRSTVAIKVEGTDVPYLARLAGEAVENAVQTDEFVQPPRAKSDILWVIDNSTSFDPFQVLIANNLPAFLTEAQGSDFQMAVTTTGLLPEHFGGSEPCPGGAGGGENGRFFPIDGSHPRILTPQTVDLELHWRNNMMVGACHALEEPIEAALRALSPPLIDEVKDSRYPYSPYEDGNAGFLRPDADLAIIFVTDQMDHSYYKSVQQYLGAFRAIKGVGRPEKFKAHAITIPATWSALPGCGFFSEERSDRIMYLVEETGGTWVNLCESGDQDGWRDGMKEMSQGTFGFTSRFAPRGIPGDRTGDGRVTAADLELFIDGKKTDPTKSGSVVWTYDPQQNAIVFTPLFIPKSGSVITLTYEIACQKQDE